MSAEWEKLIHVWGYRFKCPLILKLSIFPSQHVNKSPNHDHETHLAESSLAWKRIVCVSLCQPVSAEYRELHPAGDA